MSFTLDQTFGQSSQSVAANASSTAAATAAASPSTSTGLDSWLRWSDARQHHHFGIPHSFIFVEDTVNNSADFFILHWFAHLLTHVTSQSTIQSLSNQTAHQTTTTTTTAPSTQHQNNSVVTHITPLILFFTQRQPLSHYLAISKKMNVSLNLAQQRSILYVGEMTNTNKTQATISSTSTSSSSSSSTSTTSTSIDALFQADAKQTIEQLFHISSSSSSPSSSSAAAPSSDWFTSFYQYILSFAEEAQKTNRPFSVCFDDLSVLYEYALLTMQSSSNTPTATATATAAPQALSRLSQMLLAIQQLCELTQGSLLVVQHSMSAWATPSSNSSNTNTATTTHHQMTLTQQHMHNLSLILRKRAQLQLKLSPLQTGASKDVSGVLTVRHADSFSGWLSPALRLHYKLGDSGVRVSLPGQSTATDYN